MIRLHKIETKQAVRSMERAINELFKIDADSSEFSDIERQLTRIHCDLIRLKMSIKEGLKND